MSPTSARILLVDDDPVYREATAKLLVQKGHRVRDVPDYQLALQEIEKGEPVDLLITDIVMPKRVNGMALSRMARLRRPQLKVLYLTAYDIPGAEEEALGPILRKPVDGAQLIEQVEQALAAV